MNKNNSKETEKDSSSWNGASQALKTLELFLQGIKTIII